jgi:hypothetical protein
MDVFLVTKRAEEELHKGLQMRDFSLSFIPAFVYIEGWILHTCILCPTPPALKLQFGCLLTLYCFPDFLLPCLRCLRLTRKHLHNFMTSSKSLNLLEAF